MYNKGDKVFVLLPGGEQKGEVKEVLLNYGFEGRQETKYKVSSDSFETITSARGMSLADA